MLLKSIISQQDMPYFTWEYKIQLPWSGINIYIFLMYWDQDKYDKNYIYIDRKHSLFKCINILIKLEFKFFILTDVSLITYYLVFNNKWDDFTTIIAMSFTLYLMFSLLKIINIRFNF